MKSFISVVSFVLISIVIQAQTVPTVGEIFDYNVGDVFHYRTSPSYVPPCVSKITITGKSFSVDSNTVYYNRHIYAYNSHLENTPTMHLVYEFNEYDDMVYYENLDSLIANPVYCNDSNSVNDTIVSTALCLYPIIGFKSDNCNYPVFHEIDYAKGLGVVMTVVQFYLEDYQASDSHLLYFKKDTFECGTPDQIYESIEEEAAFRLSVSLFPNPCTDQLTIEQDENDIIGIIIFDLQSRTILELTSDKMETEIDVSKLDQGAYVASIVNLITGNHKVMRFIKQ